MKNGLFTAIVALALVACSGEKKESVDATDVDGTEVAVLEGEEVTVDASESFVSYVGSKVVGGDAHNGQIPLKNGMFEVADGKLVGGEFTVDMTQLANSDLEGEGNQKLVGHLKSADFFDVENHPEATFKVLEVVEGENGMQNITGTLTIKSTSKNITIPANVTVSGEEVTLESEFNINRTDFDVNYGSGTKFTDLAKDKVIKDIVELKVVAKS